MIEVPAISRGTKSYIALLAPVHGLPALLISADFGEGIATRPQLASFDAFIGEARGFFPSSDAFMLCHRRNCVASSKSLARAACVAIGFE